MKLNKLISISLLAALSVTGAMAQDHYLTSVAAYTDSYLSLEDGSETVYLPAAASTPVLKLKTNLEVSVSSRPSWARVTVDGNTQVSLNVKANTSASSRRGTVTLKAKDGKSLSVTLLQYGQTATLATSKPGVAFYGDRHSDSLTIWSNVAYTLSVPDWVKMADEGGGKYSFSADKIYDRQKVTGSILIKDSLGNVLKTVTATNYYADAYWFDKPNFAVISDIHIGTNDGDNQTYRARYRRWLKTMGLHDPQIRHLFIIGDLANNCLAWQYDTIVKIFNDPNLIPQDIKVTFIRGNHDNFRSDGASLFTSKIGQPYNQYQEIDGYPFISIGCTSSQYRYHGYSSETPCYDAATMQFLSESLADANEKYPGKPIFVFQHILPKYTIIGSYETDYSAYAYGLDELFSKYPQVVDFSGHTHMGVTDPHQIYQLSYTAVNDGSNKNDSNPTHFPGYKQKGAADEVDYNAVTEGLFCHFDKDDNFYIERWNTARGVNYENDWILRPPFDGTNFEYKGRTGGAAPKWPAGAAVSITDQTDTACTICFPQATDDEEVYRYLINVTNSAGTKVISQINQFSLLTFGPQRPDTLEIPVSGLPSNTQLTATVEALDAYNQSAGKISTTFTLTSK